MVVDSVDSADILNFSFSYRVVLCRQSWWQRWSFRQFKCSHTILSKELPGCFDDLFSIWNVSYSWHLLVWTWNSFCVAYRLWLPCEISKQSWTMAILWNLLLSAFVVISMSIWVIMVSNAGLSHDKILALAHANSIAMKFLQKVSLVALDCH